MQFSIYDSLAGSTLLWTEMQNGVSVSGSIYHVLLGSVTQLTPNSFSGPNAYLQVSASYGATLQTLTPRTRLTSVPFALQAEGTMPTSALILGSSPGALDYNDTGFIYSGSTIGGYPLFKKADVDTKAPTVVITRPFNYSAWTLTVPLEATFSDDLSGIDTSSFAMYLNGTTVDSGFTVTETGVTGNIDADLGINILRIEVSDKAGNRGHRSATFFLDLTGSGPAIAIYPPDAATIYTTTPEIRVDLSSYSGIDHSSLSIMINGVERREEFGVDTNADGMSYVWQVSNDAGYALNEGSNTIEVHVGNYLLLSSSDSSTFTVNDLGLHPAITSLSPAMALPGETIKIIGTNFGSTIGANEVTFFDGYGGAQGQVTSAAGNTLVVKVPQAAMSGPVKVKVGDKASEGKNFIVGFGYGLVANDHNQSYPNEISHHKLSVVIFQSDTTPGMHKNRIPLGNADPFDVAVSPDGKRAYTTDTRGNKIYMLDNSLADTETTAAVLDSMTVDMPRYVVVSPTEPEIFVGTTTGYVYRIRNNAVQDGATYKLNLGGTINELAISPLYQRLYVAKSTGAGTAGEIYWVDIDKSSDAYMQATKIQGTTYFNPIGITIKPDQSEVYVANNNSNASSDDYSFSVFNANGSSFIRTQGATITPPGDTLDVGRPRQMVFDPRGQLFYSTFAGGGAPSTYTNNIGVHKWPATDSTDFDAGTSKEITAQNENPRGIAVSPDGKWIFTASYGNGSVSRNRLKILDHAKVKLAIDNDPKTTYPGNKYNLTGPHPESLDDIITYYPNIIKYAAGFDGPQNVAFQKEPVIELYPKVIYLAEGGQREGTNVLHVRVNPIYGNSITVNLNNGSTEHITFPGDTVSFRAIWPGPDHELFSYGEPGPGEGVGIASTIIYSGDSIFLIRWDDGIAELSAIFEGYASRNATIVSPPQNFIQGLYAEALQEANEFTVQCLAAVVRNQNLFPRRIYIDSLDGDTNPKNGNQPFSFPWYDLNRTKKFGKREQITKENATELLIAKNLSAMVRQPDFNSEGDERWRDANNYYTCHYKKKYDWALKAAGDTMLDLRSTTANFPTSIQLGATVDLRLYFGTNKPDLLMYPDYTQGAINFYSPGPTQWNDNPDSMLSIHEAAGSTITDFPNAGTNPYDEKDGFFNIRIRAQFRPILIDQNRVQVVIVNGVALVNQATGRPQFVFLRLRNPEWPSVIQVNP